MTATDNYHANSREYTAAYDGTELQVPPTQKIAIVTCMDSRINAFNLLGLKTGEAHVIRNAGGVVTQDVVRSLMLSQNLLGTREIMLIQHTNCGLIAESDDAVRDAIQAAGGVRPDFRLHSFSDLEQNLRTTLAELRASELIPHRDAIRGFVFDVHSGELSEVL